MGERKTIAIRCWGRSTEYEVSLATAAAFIPHIDRSRFNPVLVGIERTTGAWHIFRGSPELIAEDRWLHEGNCLRVALSPDRITHGLIVLAGRNPLESVRLDGALPLLHGKCGEDGTVQGAFELADIPVIGCGAESSALCMDKHLAHTVARAAGVPCAESRVFTRRELKENPVGASQPDGLSYPLFVKPVRSGSSIGITLLREGGELDAAINVALAYDDAVLFEERVEGSEVGVAVLERAGQLIAGEPDEIELSGEFFDYREKYTLENSAIHTTARLPPSERQCIQELGKHVFRALGCRGFARVDFFRTRDGRLLFNEVNTIPGCTEHSRFPLMMRAAGWSFEAVVNTIIEEGLSR